MRYIAELVGAVILMLIFFWGMQDVINSFKERHNASDDDGQDGGQPAA